MIPPVHSIISRLLFVVLFVFLLAPSSEAAVAITKRGPREGQVIVREFDRLVVTILTQNKRLFQFYARDVEMVTATEKVLIGGKTPLRTDASDKGEALMVLSRGLEVKILESSKDDRWVKIQAWGTNEGWIRRDILTDRVEFSPEEKEPQGTAAETSDKIQSATRAISPNLSKKQPVQSSPQ